MSKADKLVSKTFNLMCSYNYKGKDPFHYMETITVYSGNKSPELKVPNHRKILLNKEYLDKCSPIRRRHLESTIAVLKMDW